MFIEIYNINNQIIKQIINRGTNEYHKKTKKTQNTNKHKTQTTKNPQTQLTYFLNDNMDRNTLKTIHDNFLSSDCEMVDNLNIILNTSGGSPSAAYDIAFYLRNFSKHITGYIPAGVFSSGTILALSFDKLICGDFGHLGPIDVQTPSYNAGMGFKSDSVLNLLASFEAVIEGGVHAMDISTAKIMDKSKLNIVESINASRSIVENAMTPLKNIDVNKLGDLYRARDLGAYYAYYVLKNIQGWSGEKAWDLAKFMSRNLPTHGFRVREWHLNELGLPIAKPTKDELIGLNKLAFELDEMELFQGFVELNEVLNLNTKNQKPKKAA